MRDHFLPVTTNTGVEHTHKKKEVHSLSKPTEEEQNKQNDENGCGGVLIRGYESRAPAENHHDEKT